MKTIYKIAVFTALVWGICSYFLIGGLVLTGLIGVTITTWQFIKIHIIIAVILGIRDIYRINNL